MDYGKSGTAKPARNEPRHQERKPAKPPTPGAARPRPSCRPG